MVIFRSLIVRYANEQLALGNVLEELVITACSEYVRSVLIGLNLVFVKFNQKEISEMFFLLQEFRWSDRWNVLDRIKLKCKILLSGYLWNETGIDDTAILHYNLRHGMYTKQTAKTFLFTRNSNNAKEDLVKNSWKSLKSSIINNVLSITDRKILKIEQGLKPLPKLLRADIVILRKASEIKNIWKTGKSKVPEQLPCIGMDIRIDIGIEGTHWLVVYTRVEERRRKRTNYNVRETSRGARLWLNPQYPCSVYTRDDAS